MAQRPESTSAYDSLPPKRQVFVDAYLKTGNATEAARQAGYKKPNPEGARLLANASVLAAVRERQAAAASSRIMDVVELQERYTAIARGAATATKEQLVALRALARRHPEFAHKMQHQVKVEEDDHDYSRLSAEEREELWRLTQKAKKDAGDDGG